MSRKPEFDRTQVVQNAMAVFWLKGYNATSIGDLESATGLHRGSIYAAFEHKRGLFIEVLGEYEKHLLSKHQKFDKEKSPLEAVKKSVRMFLRTCLNDREGYGCLASNTIVEMTASDKLLVKIAYAPFRKIEAMFNRRLEQAQAVGELSKAKDPKKMARTLVTHWQGIRVTASAGTGRKFLSDSIENLFSIFE